MSARAGILTAGGGAAADAELGVDFFAVALHGGAVDAEREELVAAAQGDGELVARTEGSKASGIELGPPEALGRQVVAEAVGRDRGRSGAGRR